MKKILKLSGGVLAVIFFLLIIFATNSNKETTTNYPVNPPQSSSRSFHLGFTTWPPDFTTEAVDGMYKFMEEHGDLIALHFDGGVPWPESLANEPYSQNLTSNWENTKAHTSKNAKVYLAITPMDSSREHLAKYWGASDNMDLPSPWDKYEINSQEIKRAYLNYANRAIDFFKPDYLAIGIEVNIAVPNATAWGQYKELHQYIYTELKKTHPSLPIFATISLAHLDGLEDNPQIEQQREAMRSLLQYEDIVALSAYPYGFGGREVKPVPDSFFDSVLNFGKPVAVAESGCPSQDFRALLFKYKFNNEDQKRWIATLMKAAEKHKFVFVVNWATIDFDKLAQKFPAIAQSLAGLWEYTGLAKSDGTEKPALQIWDSYFELPYRNSSS